MVSRVRVVDMVFENRISQIRENAAWTQCEVIVLVNNLITQEIKTYRIRPKVLMIPMYVLHWKNLQVFGLYELFLLILSNSWTNLKYMYSSSIKKLTQTKEVAKLAQ